MDRPTAKREACHRAALVLESQMGQGWPEYPSAEDTTKVQEAMRTLIAELTRRA
ncbi:hypothetical protein LCGC14_2240710 [marine sediment metagenome]|uniref:Uncharacterized protein n=1 Tax=marine sediment metagenome TaxID=412755 RepID=A0A0F9FI31_9ZZZZ